jgi:perosamine synthetase
MAEQLAMEGGPRTVPEGMVQSWPPLTQADREAVLAVFDSGHLHGTSAPRALELQEKWAEYCGTKYCLVTNSGTSALHMAIACTGIGPGDEVITSAFTYWSTAAAILHHNAIPVFVDIEPESFSIDPEKIEAKITDRTRGLLPVHIHGMPVDMDPILEIAKRHDLVVIEDACQAHGAEYKGRRVGSLGDTAGFSLNRSKNLSGGEGGLVTTDNENYQKAAAMLREFGEVVLQDEEREYNAYGMGWMYRQHEFVNAFVLSQFERLGENNAARQQFAGYLTEQLADIPGFEGPYTPDFAKPVYFSYIVKFKPEDFGVDMPVLEFRRAVEKALAAEGLGCGRWQQMPVPGQSVFQAKVGYGKGCPWTCAFYDREIEYRAEDYPETQAFIDAHSYLGGVYPPNTMELMELYVKGFRKVSEQVPRVLELVREQEAAG